MRQPRASRFQTSNPKHNLPISKAEMENAAHCDWLPADHATPGPGEHQPAGGGSAALSGPAFSFGPAATPAPAASSGSAGGDVVLYSGSQQQSLAQLQEQLARLLARQTRKAARKAGASVGTMSGGAAATVALPAAAAGAPGAVHSIKHQQNTHQLGRDQETAVPVRVLQTEASCQALGGEASCSSLAAVRDAVSDALQASSSRRRLAAGRITTNCSKHSTSVAAGASKGGGTMIDYTSPAPGDYFSPRAAAGSVGSRGPAFSMASKLQSNSVGSAKEAAGRLAAAGDPAAVLAAAAAVDRLAGVPGVGAYRVERPFPHPEGHLVYKPILKKVTGSSSTRASATGGSSITGGAAVVQTSVRQLSGVRRVSWADQT